jgi:hypothetical protein
MSLVSSNDDKYIAVKYFRYRKNPSIKGAHICNSFKEVIDYAFRELEESMDQSDHYNLYIVFYETPIKIQDTCDVSIISESQLDVNTCVGVENAFCEIVHGKEDDKNTPITHGYCSDAIIVYKAN